jgi:translation initiation factor IF-2
VVTIMGHVDHGKTSLLDAIRSTNVVMGEAGGITQHIGAYHVTTPRGDVVFLDTPGHEAFTAMRARGAKVTDIVVLVVAADDGVMDQTREAINHSKAAGVPMVVAVNKIDKPGAEPDRVKRELAELGLVPEEWGGETIFAYVSAKQRLGLDELLEMILLQAEVLDLKSNPDKRAKGHIIEAKLDKGRGPVATVLIEEGTLSQGDAFVCGLFSGRVRAMFDDQGRKIKEAGPAMPVEVQGFEGVPEAGETFSCVEDEKVARRIAETRLSKQRERELGKATKLTLETFLASRGEAEAQELKLVLKADVQGSQEAIAEALNKLSGEKVKVRIIHAGAGAITESDVILASASEAIVIGFNVRPSVKVKEIAERENVDLRFYDIIYKLVDEIKAAMSGMLAPVLKEQYLGQAEVRQTFSVPKVGVVAGCGVLDGKITRNAQIRLLRDGVVVYTGKLASLKRFKDDVKEVTKGYECGMGLENFNDVKMGDVIEAFETVEEKDTLD